MDTIDPETKEQILNRTLEAVHARRLQRERRLKKLASASMLCVVGALGIGLGLFVGHERGDGRLGETNDPGIPPRVADGPIRAASFEEVVDSWDPPSALVLVVNEDGMEIKPLNDAQVAALARKPGCEFGFTTDAVMWASENGIEGAAFSPPLEF